MIQLDGGERAMLMNGIGHGGQGGNIRVGPQPAFVEGLAIAGRMNLHLLGRDHRPASLGLDAA